MDSNPKKMLKDNEGNEIIQYKDQVEENKDDILQNLSQDDEVQLEEGIVDENFQDKVHKLLYDNDNGMNLYNKPKMPIIFYEFSEDIKNEAQAAIDQDQSQLPDGLYLKYEKEASKCWDKFYRFHQDNFFKDRHYLEREIQELTIFKEQYEKDNKNQYIFCEMGCGVGNTIFPIMKNYQFFSKVEGFDFSQKAIEVVKKSEFYKPDEMDVCVCDLVHDPLPLYEKPDLSTLIFVLSAISPENHLLVVQKIYDWMKPGSVIYFRDYGRYDFGQINLSRKKNRKLKDNFYVKNDGVRVYYFTNEEVSQLFQSVGFEQLSLSCFYRYIENRKTKLKMYRVWVQGRFIKPHIQSLE